MANVNLDLSVTMLRFLKVMHATLAPVRLVSSPTSIRIDGEEYLPYPFEVRRTENEAEFEILPANGFGLAWLELVGECDAVLSFGCELRGFPLKIVGRLEGRLVYREGLAIFIVSRASVDG